MWLMGIEAQPGGLGTSGRVERRTGDRGVLPAYLNLNHLQPSSPVRRHIRERDHHQARDR